MGIRARHVRERTERRIRSTPLTDAEKQLLASATYEGSPYHKREPRDFGLTPPANPRPDATLCDDVGEFDRESAKAMFAAAIERGLVSQATSGLGYPKQIWLVHDGHVFEAMYGGSVSGAYHGYPVRRSDPLSDEMLKAWTPE